MYPRLETPSGSRAPSRYHWEYDDDYEHHEHEEEGDDALFQTEEGPQVNSDSALYQERTYASGQTLAPGVPFTSKIPPQYHGNTCWFTYEENVRDWVAMTEIPEVKQGPLLKSGLQGYASIYLSLIHI